MNPKVLLLTALPVLLAGCGGQPERGDFPPLYRPGDKLDVTARSVHSMSTPTVHISSAASEMDLRIEARRGATAGEVELVLRIVRVAGAATQGTVGMQSYDSDQPPPGDEARAAAFRKNVEAMKALRLTATIDPNGRIARFAYDDVPMDWSRPPEKGQEPADRLPWQTAAIVRGILGESLAYLPMNPVAKRQRWQLARQHVFPMHVYPTAMLMGNAILAERSTCRVKDIDYRPEGRIAEIAFSGRREALVPPEVEPSGATLKCSGAARLNIDTGRFDLRVESEVQFPRGRDAGGKSWFADELTIKPVLEMEEKE